MQNETCHGVKSILSWRKAELALAVICVLGEVNLGLFLD